MSTEELADEAAKRHRETRESIVVATRNICDIYGMADSFNTVLGILGRRGAKAKAVIRQHGVPGRRMSGFLGNLEHAHKPTGDEYYLNGSLA